MKVWFKKVIVWDPDEGEFKATLFIGLPTCEYHTSFGSTELRLVKELRNPHEELLGENLKYNWGRLDDNGEYRVKRDYEYFATYDEAVEWLNDRLEGVVSFLKEVYSKNIENLKRHYEESGVIDLKEGT